MRTAAEDLEVTNLLRELDRIEARLAELGIDLAIVRPRQPTPASTGKESE